MAASKIRNTRKTSAKTRKTSAKTRKTSAKTRKTTKHPRRRSSASPRPHGADKRTPARRRDSAAAPDLPAGKLHKVLAELGYGSRREIEGWIAAGRITVNGEPAHVGQRVGGGDRLAVDGEPVSPTPAHACRVLVLNKRTGVICTRRDPEERRTIFDDLPDPGAGRWISVGRLDVQTSGLLLVTNDGALAHRMMHPSTGLDREYAVRVGGRLSDEETAMLRDGVDVDGERLRFSDLRYYDGAGHNHWYHVVLREGRNREVRRLFESVGRVVSRLKRVRYGPVVLPSTLRNGQSREMNAADLTALYGLLGLPLTLPAAPRTGRAPSRQARASMLLPYPTLPARE